MRFIIPGRIPSKKNSRNLFMKKGKMFNIPQKKYKEWHLTASKLLMGKKPVCGLRSAHLEFWMPDNRKADLTNKAESELDLLVDCHIIPDDSWQCCPEVHLIARGVDKDSPRVQVTLTGAWNHVS